MSDLDLLTIGMVNEMAYERDRDSETFDLLPTQADFDAF